MSTQRLLLDANLSPRLAEALRRHGIDACHVADMDLSGADDETIFARAAAVGQVVVSFDLDFAALKASAPQVGCGVILLRLPSARVAAVLPRLLAALKAESDALAKGAIVIVEPTRLRVRHPPA